jgi:hypothetical protein
MQAIEDVIKQAAAANISLTADDFDEDGRIDGMDAYEWLDAMTMD